MATDKQSRLQQLLLDGIADRNQAEDEARSSRELIDDTASAVAKALRNELTVVSGNVELIGMQHVSDAVQRFAGNAQLAATSANQVVQRLSLLKSFGKSEKSGIDVHSELSSLRSALENLVGSNIRLEWDSEPGKLSLNSDPEEFRMMILEILQNGLDAMPMGGTLTITSREMRLQTQLEDNSRWWLAIECSDTGKGMSEAQCAAALAPSTQIDGEANLALGLCLVDRFVNELKGVLSISGVEGRGTTVTVLLPLASAFHRS